MNTPLSWIKAYVPDLECTDQEQSAKVLKDLMLTLIKLLLDKLKKLKSTLMQIN